ncbi:MAG: cob(I)yrinic acid a,c-diamide adenosyltransferase [Sphingobacteriales bacterium]|nr:cob(I)yrinic acid a,c-diamide adenosyltransferase [Sphingobacteriales bacterium]
MATRIYTKTGDRGSTSLIGGTRVSKSHLRIEAYGTVDELNSHIGLCRDLITDEASRSSLREIQDRLFTIGSSLACDPARESKMRLPDLNENDVEWLEKEMDRMDETLPEMKSFILPGGHPIVSQLHIARCVARRAERCCVRLEPGEAETDLLILRYLNRLSDYLFMLSRYSGMQLKVAEIPWKPRLRNE